MCQKVYTYTKNFLESLFLDTEVFLYMIFYIYFIAYSVVNYFSLFVYKNVFSTFFLYLFDIYIFFKHDKNEIIFKSRIVQLYYKNIKTVLSPLHIIEFQLKY